MRVREVLGAHLTSGARDVLYVAASADTAAAVNRELVHSAGALFGLRVISAAGLPREIERRGRVGSLVELDNLAADLLTERALRNACGTKFSPEAPIHGLARQAGDLIESLRRAGATRADLQNALCTAGGANEGAQHLLDAWAQWDAIRPPEACTGADVVFRAAGLLREDAGLLSGCELIVLDNLPLDHRADRELVAALVESAPGVVVATYAAPRQLSGTAAVRRLVALRAITNWEEQECPAAPSRFRSAVDRVFTSDPLECALDLPPGAEVRLLESVGEPGEVRLAARVVRRHLRTGVPAEDIQIVLRSPDRYLPLIEEVFAAAEIPVAVSRHFTLAEVGIGEVLVRLLQAALHPENCGREESLMLLRTPYLDFEGPVADHFERRVRTGGHLGFTTWESLVADGTGGAALDRVRRFRDALLEANREFQVLDRPEGAARVARRMSQELRLLGNMFFARARAARRGGDDPALRTRQEAMTLRDNQAWEEIEEILERMPELLQIEGIADGVTGSALAARWVATFAGCLSTIRIRGQSPVTGAVRVAGTMAARPARVTLVLGLLEKEFPRAARQDVFLRDEVRRALREREGWHLPLSDELIEEEREQFLLAIGSATDVLYLSSATTDSAGKPALPSLFLRDLERVCPIAGRERLRPSDLTPPLDDASSAADLLAAVAHDTWQHLPAGELFLRRRAGAFSAHDELISRGIDAGSVRGARRHEVRPTLDAALFEGAPHRTLRLSASQLRTIGHCTYAHYVDKVLSPDTLDWPAYDALRKGSLIHDAVMEWSTTLEGWTRGEAALAEADHWVEERIERWPPSMRGDPISQHQAEATRERLREFLRAEFVRVQSADPTQARPRFHELGFGGTPDGAGSRDPASVSDEFPLQFEVDGALVTARFRGSIDRVDVFERDGRLYGVALDFKTGRSARHYAKEMFKGNDLQLRLYMLALEHFWNITPVGALFLGFGDGIRRGVVHEGFASDVPLSEDDDVRRFGEVDWEAFVRDDTLERITPLIGRLVNLDITAAPRANDCGFCSFRPICRFDRFADEAAHA